MHAIHKILFSDNSIGHVKPEEKNEQSIKICCTVSSIPKLPKLKRKKKNPAFTTIATQFKIYVFIIANTMEEGCFS